MRVSIVPPVFNEAASVDALYQRPSAIAAKVEGEVEFIFVDDGSDDDSGVKIAALRASDKRVKLVNPPRNFGYGAVAPALDQLD